MTPASDGRRNDAIDFIKAAAIIAVVATHSGINVFHPAATAWDRVLTATWTWYQVPAFLLVSGFLYYSERPASLRDVTRRLSRVWIPYVLASLLMQALAPSHVGGPAQALFQIATASARGPYYYIALFTGCTLMLWPLSRIGHKGSDVLLAALLTYAVALSAWPGLHVPASYFWMERNPLEGFRLGYFVVGWVAAQHREWLALRLAQHRLLIGCVAGAGVVFWFASLGHTFNRDIIDLKLVLYTLSVVALIVVVTHGRRAPRAVRFLSTVSLTIYLYHLAPLAATNLWVRPWPPLVRIVFQLVLGIGSGCLLALAGRRVLGSKRARRLLGA